MCKCKLLLFPQFCLLYFPRQQQNHPFTHLHHAISHPLSSCHPPKTFPIHSQQHTLSNCSGQCGRLDIQTGNRKKCWNYSDQVRLDDGKQGRRRHARRVTKWTFEVSLTFLLVLISVIKNGQLKTCPNSLTHIDFITGQNESSRIIFSSMRWFYQRSPDNRLQLCGIMLRWETEAFACRRAHSAVMQRSPHPHWGWCH